MKRKVIVPSNIFKGEVEERWVDMGKASVKPKGQNLRSKSKRLRAVQSH